MLSQQPSNPLRVVLVVEDEPLIRMMAAGIIEDAGFAALEATNASEALVLLKARNDISLIFADIDLGAGMDGLHLAFLIRNRWPLVELIVTSGRSSRDEIKLPERGLFLSKPYCYDDLAGMVESLLT
ncbi:response regulator (plasmid) [Novosphingobium sp. BL-8A]|uniref:response regulator n=1 Tax=Novosphingobium sp. BL-8A TaxID=3127639 RepID=UPI003757F72E